MKAQTIIGAGLIFAALILGGCSAPENVPKSFSPQVMQKHADFKGLYTKTGGDWGRLSDAEQKQFASDWTHGSLEQAKIFWEQQGKDEISDGALSPAPSRN